MTAHQAPPSLGFSRQEYWSGLPLPSPNSAMKRNRFESVLMTWTKLEPIMQNEVSQKEEYKYCILTHISEWNGKNLKRWHWWIYFQCNNGETHIKNRPMDRMGGEEGEGEMYGESNIEIHNTICKIDSQWEFAVWLRDLKHGLCERLKGEVGRKMGGRSRREGTWVYLWLILVGVWQKTTKFYKAITFQLKNNNKKLFVLHRCSVNDFQAQDH